MNTETPPFVSRHAGGRPAPPRRRSAAESPKTERPAQGKSPLTAADKAFALVFEPKAGEAARRKAGQELIAGYMKRYQASFARRSYLSSEDVEELFVDATHRFLKSVPRDCECPQAWFRCTFKNLLKSRLRWDAAQRRIPGHLMDAMGSPGDENPAGRVQSMRAVDDPLEALLWRERMEQLLLRVEASSPQRARVLLLVVEGYTLTEIAQRLGTTYAAVRDMIFQVRGLLRAEVKETRK